MGKEKQTTNTSSNNTQTQAQNQTQTQQAMRTPEETRLSQLEMERAEATNPGLIAAQNSGLNLVNLLLQGNEPLPGFFQKLSQGISPEITGEIASESIADIQPYFQKAGLLDSGVNASISGRVAGDVRRASEEFNIGNRLNLLNLALSGQAQVQSPILAQSQMLSARLAGLRPMTSTGTGTASGSFQGYGTSTSLGMNPFLKSFQTSLGQTLGAPRFQMGPVSVGGS